MSLKRTEAVLDMKNDRAWMFNQSVELEFISSGHYCVKITDKNNTPKEVQHKEQIVTSTSDDIQ